MNEIKIAQFEHSNWSNSDATDAQVILRCSVKDHAEALAFFQRVIAMVAQEQGGHVEAPVVPGKKPRKHSEPVAKPAEPEAKAGPPVDERQLPIPGTEVVSPEIAKAIETAETSHEGNTPPLPMTETRTFVVTMKVGEPPVAAKEPEPPAFEKTPEEIAEEDRVEAEVRQGFERVDQVMKAFGAVVERIRPDNAAHDAAVIWLDYEAKFAEVEATDLGLQVAKGTLAKKVAELSKIPQGQIGVLMRTTIEKVRADRALANKPSVLAPIVIDPGPAEPEAPFDIDPPKVEEAPQASDAEAAFLSELAGVQQFSKAVTAVLKHCFPGQPFTMDQAVEGLKKYQSAHPLLADNLEKRVRQTLPYLVKTEKGLELTK